MGAFSIFLILIVIVALLLILVIMVQNPKGGGLSSTFGGGGSQAIGGVKNTTDFLDRSTWVLATILVALILSSGFVISRTANSSEESRIEEKVQKMEIPEEIPMDVDTTAGSKTK